MDRYFLFRKLMDLMADYGDITDAQMQNYCGDMVITAEIDGQTAMLTFEVKEGKKDA